ncbi:MAG: malonyl-ACP O-methyltransferase BioC [Gammaproteobacteria bacterium]|nr:malonyl-ACP O-methyltransferase BioC [Gammaproteobacteria bacterium]
MLDKARLVQRFNDAALAYEEAALLQRYTAEQLYDRLQIVNIQPKAIMDLGSGTGRSASGLARLFSGAHIVQMDIAINMLRYAKRAETSSKSKFSYLCADADFLPVAESTVDLVHSNLMFQWSSRPGTLISDIFRIMRDGGLFIFATLGPDTLGELRSSWASVDDGIHVNDFMDMRDIGDALVQAGFADPVMEVDHVTMAYESVLDLLKDLKKLGANNANTERRHTLTGKNRFLRMQSYYEKCRTEEKLPATYEIVYGHAWAIKKSEKRSQAEFQISLDSLKGALSQLKGKQKK